MQWVFSNLKTYHQPAGLNLAQGYSLSGAMLSCVLIESCLIKLSCCWWVDEHILSVIESCFTRPEVQVTGCSGTVSWFIILLIGGATVVATSAMASLPIRVPCTIFLGIVSWLFSPPWAILRARESWLTRCATWPPAKPRVAMELCLTRFPCGGCCGVGRGIAIPTRATDSWLAKLLPCRFTKPRTESWLVRLPCRCDPASPRPRTKESWLTRLARCRVHDALLVGRDVLEIETTDGKAVAVTPTEAATIDGGTKTVDVLLPDTTAAVGSGSDILLLIGGFFSGTNWSNLGKSIGPWRKQPDPCGDIRSSTPPIPLPTPTVARLPPLLPAR